MDLGLYDEPDPFQLIFTDIREGILDENARKACDYCDHKYGFLFCEGCGEARYCSRACQKDDLPLHRLLCASAKKNFKLSEKRNSHIRGILFPVDSHKPSFVWLDTENPESFSRSVLGALGINVEKMLPPTDINRRISHRWLHHGILEYITDLDRDFDNQKINDFNQSTALLSRPGLTRFHYGPQLFCGFRKGNAGREIFYEDATMKDFRAIIDLFQTRISPSSIIANVPRYPGVQSSTGGINFQAWPAVKFNCDGDIERLSSLIDGKPWPRVEEVFVASHPESNLRHPVYLAQLAGLPWLVESIFDDQLRRRERENYGGRNFKFEVTTSLSGQHILETNLRCGSLIIVGKDGTPIHPDHVLAFNDFTEAQFQKLYKQDPSKGGMILYSIPITLAAVRPLFTRERFTKYWNDWVKQSRKMTRAHNVTGVNWYPYARVYNAAPCWNPYSLVGLVLTEKDERRSGENVGGDEGTDNADTLDKRTKEKVGDCVDVMEGSGEKSPEWCQTLIDAFKHVTDSFAW